MNTGLQSIIVSPTQIAFQRRRNQPEVIIIDDDSEEELSTSTISLSHPVPDHPNLQVPWGFQPSNTQVERNTSPDVDDSDTDQHETVAPTECGKCDSLLH